MKCGGDRDGAPNDARQPEVQGGRRLAWALSPLLVAAIGACASSPSATTVKRGTIPARPALQQPAAASAQTAPAARPQVRVYPGRTSGPVVTGGDGVGEPPASAASRAVTTVPLPPLTAAARAAAARAAAARAAAARTAAVRQQPAVPEATAIVSPPPLSPPPAAAEPAPPDNVVGRPLVYTAKYEDTLLDLAVDNGFGFLEIRAANPGVDPWLPGAGTPILLPHARILPTAPREGLVLNLPEQRLFLFKKGRLVDSFPIGVFRDGFSTPIGSTSVVRKVVDPTWYPTASTRRDDPTLPAAVPPGPDNPLGTRAMYLGWPMYLIHGTHKPYGIGRRVSRGCIRMYPANSERLYDMVPVGTRVHVVNQPVKIGWWRGELFVQAHPTMQQGVALEETGRIEPIEIPDIRGKIEAKAGPAGDRIDWPTVDRALKERRGYPVQVTSIDRPIEALPSATIGTPLLSVATDLTK